VESGVGELSLKIRTRAAQHPETRHEVETFAARVLDRCAALIDSRAAGRVVRIRELSMRWRLRDTVLASGDEVDAVARELAAAIDAEVGTASPPGTNSNLAVFVDESHWGAASLRALGTLRATPWWSAQFVGAEETPGILADPKRHAFMAAVLRQLAADGDIVRVLNGLSGELSVAIVHALSLDDVLAAHLAPGMIPNIAASYAVSDAVSRLLRTLAPSLSRPVLALVCHGILGHLLGTDVPPREAVLAAVAAYDAQSRTGSLPPVPRTVLDQEDGSATRELESASVDATATAVAGLVYLIRPALEMDVGETLWRSCLDERGLLSRTWRRIAMTADPAFGSDPAIALLGGADPAAAAGVIDAERQMEIAPALLSALGSALGRYGRRPETLRLALSHRATGRMLVAWLDGAPLPVFVWPASGPGTLRAGVRAAVAVWPIDTVIIAPPALAELAPARRVAHEPRGGPGSASRAIASVSAATDDADTVVLQVAGVVATLVACRAGWPFAEMSVRLAGAAAVAGEIIATRECIEVVIPMSRIDIGLRRVGLDRDPGWTPWLGRMVRIDFREDAAAIERPLPDRER
jgi:hypothetical protein